MVAEEIILAPVVTEKSSADMQEGKYTFRVAKKATKIDIQTEIISSKTIINASSTMPSSSLCRLFSGAWATMQR